MSSKPERPDRGLAANENWRDDTVCTADMNIMQRSRVLLPKIQNAEYFDRDRATYNSSSSDQVTYTVASSADAPSSLTFGPSFFTLANSYAGNIILGMSYCRVRGSKSNLFTVGLNRRLNNLPNTISAASRALSSIATLDAIELGNEPNCKLVFGVNQDIV